MKKFIASLIVALALSSPAHAQLLTLGAGPGGVAAAGGAYSGPGDVVSGATAYWGLRAYNAAKATANVAAIQICTALDAACTDIHVTSTGGLSASDITTSGCSGIDTCTIKTWYDQTGNGYNATQTTIASRATYTRSCTGLSSLPCAAGGGTAYYASSNLPDTSGSLSYTLVCGMVRTSNFTTENDCMAMHPGGYVTMGAQSSTNHSFFYAGGSSISGSSTDSSWHFVQGVGNASAGSVTIDGSTTTGSATSTQMHPASPMNLMGLGAGSMSGNAFEFGIWQGVSFTGTQLSNMNTNAHTYGGY